MIDRDGNAVAVTYTINGGFGAGVIAPGTGFFLNDEMDDFTVKPGVANLFGLVQGEANAIAPGKRPLSSMAPTLVEKDGRVVLALGSPGGSRIITTVLETALNLIDYGMAAAGGGRRAALPPSMAARRGLRRTLRLLARHARSCSRRWATRSSSRRRGARRKWWFRAPPRRRRRPRRPPATPDSVVRRRDAAGLS